MKLCKWCEEPLDTPYAKVRCHKGCSTHFQHHRKPKRLVGVKEPFPCYHCGKTVTRREDETLQAWSKRKYCNKTCAALAKQEYIKTRTGVLVESEQERIGVRRYIPGTPEFETIAALYL